MSVTEKTFISPDDGYAYFFGYYDLQPFSQDKKIHLAHRVKFINRLPTAADEAETGYIDVESKRFTAIARTQAWNFQQGAFLRWFERDDSVTFNDFDGQKYVSRVVDLHGNELRRYNRPFAALSVEKGVGLSVNFGRIYDFRKGYGYVNLPDPFQNENAPAEDGIVAVDLKSGNSEIVLSYKRMKELFEEEPFTCQKLVVNHITFNPSGDKYVFLLRNNDPEGKKWGTVLAVGDLKGNTVKLTGFEVNSHYSWKDDENLMIYSGLPEWGIYFINTVTGERRRLNDALMDKGDIHCNYSPDRSCFIGDGYPEKDGKRYLYYYDFATKKSRALFGAYSLPLQTDIRCDLHARWSDDGTLISYDTTEDGNRRIAVVPFQSIK